MDSIQTLRERRAALAREMNALVSNTGALSWNADDHGKRYDAMVDEIARVDAHIDRLTDAARRTAEAADAEVAAEATARVDRGAKSRGSQLFDKFLRRGYDGMSADEITEIRNTMSTTTSSEGGYTVPAEVSSTIVDALKAYGGMRAVSRVIQTAGFGALSFPTSDGTSETGELIAENTTATGADPSFGTVAVSAYKYSSKIVAIPFELLQDTAVDMEAFVRGRLVDRLGRITNTHFTTGTGSGQPRGVVVGSGVGKTGTTGQTTSVIFDDLVDLVHSIDPAYRAAPSCRFMMNDGSLAKVRKLKDSQNRPIFLPGYDGMGGPMGDRLLGYPITINQDVAAMGANAKSILFGDFGYYVVRDVMSLSLFRFTDSAYTKLGQVGFLAWMRSGGNLIDAAAVKHYANSAT